MRKTSGQVILTILLIMVVGLTVSLAVVARSVTSVKISTQEEESQRAFSAAEAGLEEAILSGAACTDCSIGDASYTVRINPGGASDTFLFPETIEKDETQALWLVGHDAAGEILPPGAVDPQRYNKNTINICWTGVGGTPAMEIIVIYQNINNKKYALARGAYDPDSGRTGQNKFSAPNTSGSDCGGFSNHHLINFQTDFNIDLVPPTNQRAVTLRLRPIYDDARVAVQSEGGVNLPPQGSDIESTGAVGATQRKVKIFKSYPTLPAIFDFALFSGQPLIK